MSTRKNTPQNKVRDVASRFRTPPNLNSTVAFGSSSRNPRYAQTSSARTHLDMTLVSNPPMKMNLTVVPQSIVDYELEYDFAFNEYLQASMKRHLVIYSMQRIREEVADQLAIKQDILMKMRRNLENMKAELVEAENLAHAACIQEALQSKSEEFCQMTSDLESNLQQTKAILNEACNKIDLKNFKPVISQEEYDKLIGIIEQCNLVSTRIRLAGRDFEGAERVAGALEKFAEFHDALMDNRASMDDMTRSTVYMAFRKISDLFAS